MHRLKYILGHLRQPFRSYLQYTLSPNGAHSPVSRTQHLLCLYCFMQLLLMFVPLDDFRRLLLCDLMLLYRLPPRFNWIILLFTLDAMYFLGHIFSCPKVVSTILQQILYEDNTSFFVSKQIKHKSGQKDVGEIVRYYFNAWIIVCKYFNPLGVIICLFYHCMSGYLMSLDGDYYFGTLSGYLSALAITCSCIISDNLVLVYAFVHNVFSLVLCTFTAAVFLKLSQVNSLLSHSRLDCTTLRYFFEKHTQTLLVIFQFNRFIGKLIFAFILLHFPISTFSCMAILLGHLGAMANFVFGNLALIQFVVLIFFHILGAVYSSRIYACRRRLFYWSCRSMHQANFRCQLQLLQYIGKFNTRNRYGITYASIGLMSYASFFKFAVIYFKLLIYWKKMMHSGLAIGE